MLNLGVVHVVQSNISPPPFQDAGGQVRTDLSVIIVNWNVRDDLLRCLGALHEPAVVGELHMEIIVVDNASSDGSVEALNRFGDVRLIVNDENRGYGEGNNQGLEIASGKHLLILNPDTIPQAGSLGALVGFLEDRPSVGIASPRLLNRDGSVQSAAFKFPTLLMAALDLFPAPTWVPGRLRRWLSHSRFNGRYPGEGTAEAPFRIDHPLGACMLINRAAYQQLGGFDPELFMYSEEIDLAMRYTTVGWECWQVPSARVVHLGGQSTSQMPANMLVELWRSRLHVYRKHYTVLSRIGLRALLLLAQVLKVGATVALRITDRLDRAEARRRLRLSGALWRLALRE